LPELGGLLEYLGTLRSESAGFADRFASFGDELLNAFHNQ